LIELELIFGWTQIRDPSLEMKAERNWFLQSVFHVGSMGWVFSRLQKEQRSCPKPSVRHPGFLML